MGEQTLGRRERGVVDRVIWVPVTKVLNLGLSCAGLTDILEFWKLFADTQTEILVI